MPLKQYDTEELLAEIKRRELAKRLPSQISTPNFKPLEGVIKDYIAEVAVEPKADFSDAVQHIFESAVEAMYGKDIWEWLDTVQELP